MRLAAIHLFYLHRFQYLYFTHWQSDACHLFLISCEHFEFWMLWTFCCRHMPGHASREVLIVMGSLTTCDPDNIISTISVSHHTVCQKNITVVLFCFVGYLRKNSEISLTKIYSNKDLQFPVSIYKNICHNNYKYPGFISLYWSDAERGQCKVFSHWSSSRGLCV